VECMFPTQIEKTASDPHWRHTGQCTAWTALGSDISAGIRQRCSGLESIIVEHCDATAGSTAVFLHPGVEAGSSAA